MQLVNCLVALGGDPRNTVPKYGITVAEAHVLRAIHGHESLLDVQPLDEESDVSPRAEITHLAETYFARDEDGANIVSKVFAGGVASVPMEIADLDLPETSYRVVERVAPPAPKRKRAKVEPASAVKPVDDGNDDVDDAFA
jgi:hypothetical protein